MLPSSGTIPRNGAKRSREGIFWLQQARQAPQISKVLSQLVRSAEGDAIAHKGIFLIDGVTRVRRPGGPESGANGKAQEAQQARVSLRYACITPIGRFGWARQPSHRVGSRATGGRRPATKAIG